MDLGIRLEVFLLRAAAPDVSKIWGAYASFRAGGDPHVRSEGASER